MNQYYSHISAYVMEAILLSIQEKMFSFTLFFSLVGLNISVECVYSYCDGVGVFQCGQVIHHIRNIMEANLHKQNTAILGFDVLLRSCRCICLRVTR